MIININELTNFKSDHSYKAEIAIMNAICFMYDLLPGSVTTGNFAPYDFSINDKTFELKISSKGTSNGVIELSKADGRPGGLSATEADYHIFLNPAGGNIAKLRIIPTYELIAYYNTNTGTSFKTDTVGDKIGSVLAPLNFRNFNDLMVGECSCDFKSKTFNTHTFKSNSFAQSKIEYLFR